MHLFSKPEERTNKQMAETHLIWENMDFGATEAYNLLRTNLMLSFADEEGGRLIGMTSSGHAEGKSLTSINLAGALAKAGQKTLLLECDLRLPVIARYLRIRGKDGLSEYLTGLENNLYNVIFPVEACENLSVIFCGRTPPNPSELLGSRRMENVLKELSGQFKYVIVDLPPVGLVPDPLVLAKKLSGMAVVVRGDVATQPAVADTIRQLRYADARILGFIYNGAERSGSGYHGKYYKKYGYGGYSHAVPNKKGNNRSGNGKSTAAQNKQKEGGK